MTSPRSHVRWRQLCKIALSIMVLSAWSCSHLQVTLPQTDAEARDVVSWPFPCNCVVPFLLHAKLPRQNSQSGTGPECSDASACNRVGCAPLVSRTRADHCLLLTCPRFLSVVPAREPDMFLFHLTVKPSKSQPGHGSQVLAFPFVLLPIRQARKLCWPTSGFAGQLLPFSQN